MNLFGPGDNFSPTTSHVIPAIMRKCIEARMADLPAITLWGDGSATREFLYVDDAAEGIVRALRYYDGAEPVNLGAGREISISDLACRIARLVGYEGQINWDTSFPNGQPRRCLDTARAKECFGFEAHTTLDDGLRAAYEWYMEHKVDIEEQVHCPADYPGPLMPHD